MTCLFKGWETGHEYVYKYTGRTIVGINSLKQQNAVVELHSRIAVQAHDETTILVKVWWKKPVIKKCKVNH